MELGSTLFYICLYTSLRWPILRIRIIIRWSADDLIKVAEVTGCKLAFIAPDGERLYLTTEKSPDRRKSGLLQLRRCMGCDILRAQLPTHRRSEAGGWGEPAICIFPACKFWLRTKLPRRSWRDHDHECKSPLEIPASSGARHRRQRVEPGSTVIAIYYDVY